MKNIAIPLPKTGERRSWAYEMDGSPSLGLRDLGLVTVLADVEAALLLARNPAKTIQKVSSSPVLELFTPKSSEIHEFRTSEPCLGPRPDSCNAPLADRWCSDRRRTRARGCGLEKASKRPRYGLSRLGFVS